MNIVDFLNLLVAAVLLAGVYAAMSVGMTIIYGVLKIVNLAHAGFLMLGAYFVYELYTRFSVDPLLGVILAFPVFFLIGAAVYWLLVRRIPRRISLPCPLFFFSWTLARTSKFGVLDLGQWRSCNPDAKNFFHLSNRPHYFSDGPAGSFWSSCRCTGGPGVRFASNVVRPCYPRADAES